MHRRRSSLDREFKEKGGSLVVSSGIGVKFAAESGISRNDMLLDCAAGDHRRVNALLRENEAYGRRLPLKMPDGISSPRKETAPEESKRHARVHTLKNEVVNDNP